MKPQTFWLNLPVKDLEKSKQFFRQLGFTENPMHVHNPTCGSFLIGKDNFCVMLFPEATLATFSNFPIADTTQSVEVLLNIDAQSRDEVDAWAALAEKSGGTVFSQPGESQGWMYACGFADLDGHRWCVLYMDMEKMPK